MDSSTTEMSECVFINATPHPIKLFDLLDPNKILYEFPTSGMVIRLQDVPTTQTPVTALHCDASVMLTGLQPGCDSTWIQWSDLNHPVTNPTELPAWEYGKFYIVSRIVAEACRDRFDLVFPYDLVRNDEGAIVGCRGFARIER
jgi:hypothetical protein